MEGKQKHIMKKISNVPTGVSVAFIQRSYADSQRSFSSKYLICCSVTQWCLTLCNPRDCSPPGSSVLHYLPVCSNSCPLSSWCHPTISSSGVPFSSCPQSLPASDSFQMSQLFASGGQSTGVSALVSFLPKKSQGWSPSEWTGWISLQSKELSRVF